MNYQNEWFSYFIRLKPITYVTSTTDPLIGKVLQKSIKCAWEFLLLRINFNLQLQLFECHTNGLGRQQRQTQQLEIVSLGFRITVKEGQMTFFVNFLWKNVWKSLILHIEEILHGCTLFCVALHRLTEVEVTVSYCGEGNHCQKSFCHCDFVITHEHVTIQAVWNLQTFMGVSNYTFIRFLFPAVHQAKKERSNLTKKVKGKLKTIFLKTENTITWGIGSLLGHWCPQTISVTAKIRHTVPHGTFHHRTASVCTVKFCPLSRWHHPMQTDRKNHLHLRQRAWRIDWSVHLHFAKCGP